MIKLVAFDWNGTLLSDTTACCQASNQILDSRKLPKISIQKFRQTFKIPAIHFYMANGIKKTYLLKNAKSLSTNFIKYYEPLAKHSRSRAGVKKTLNWLHQKNIKAIIFSNHTFESINTNLKRLGLSSKIQTIIAHKTNEGTHYKNMNKNFKETVLAQYAKTVGLKSKEIVVVGDTEEEIDIGRTYDFHSVAITGGYNSTARLKKSNPDFLIHNMLELKKIIKKLSTIGGSAYGGNS